MLKRYPSPLSIFGRFKPRLLDFYILTEVAQPLVGGIAFFTFIFLMFQLLRLAEFFIVHGVPFLQLLEIATLLSISFLPFALPISFLIALLLGFGRLSGDSELIAMKAGGYSLKRLSLMPFLLACVVCILSLALNLEFIPKTERTLKQRLVAVGNSRLVSSIHEGTFTRGFFDLLVYADRVDTKTNRMEGVFIYDEREPKNPLTIVAKHGQWISRPERGGGLTAILDLREGNIHRSEIGDGSYQKVDFGEYRLFLKMDGGNAGFGSKPKMMSFRELRRSMESQGTPKDRQRGLSGELWRRVAVSLAPLFFVLLGMGAGILPTRSVKSGSALIAFLVLLAYYSLLGAGSELNERGILPAFVALQLGNLVVGMWGAISFRRALR